MVGVPGGGRRAGGVVGVPGGVVGAPGGVVGVPGGELGDDGGVVSGAHCTQNILCLSCVDVPLPVSTVSR